MHPIHLHILHDFNGTARGQLVLKGKIQVQGYLGMDNARGMRLGLRIWKREATQLGLHLVGFLFIQ